MRVPQLFADLIANQPLDFLYRLFGVLARLEDEMHNEVAKLADYLDKSDQLVARHCDLCQQNVPRETIAALLHMTRIEIDRRELAMQTERND